MEIVQIPLSSVYPSPMNPRKTFFVEDLRELADNIEKQGLLQPITVRPIRDVFKFMEKAKAGKGYPIDGTPICEIVCGERRYRAMSMLHDKWSDMDCVAPSGHTFNRFSTITAIVKEMDDDEAFDAMITENLQRKDVDPIEEAFAFGQLAEKGKTTEEIAARFGKSVRFVTERIKLNSLIPELMLAVKEDRMPIVAAQIICKLDESAQRKFFSQYSRSENPTFNRNMAESFTHSFFMDIENAVWNRSEGFANAEFDGGCGTACSVCQFNTANHGCLFYEMKCKDRGRCTDRERFNEKSRAFIKSVLESRRGSLVGKGQPLEYGMTVVAAVKAESYEGDDVKRLKGQVADDIARLGIEAVDTDKVFKSRCFYDNDDERTVALASSGEVYRVLSLFNYCSPLIREQYWYVKPLPKSEDADGIPSERAVPAEVMQLMESINAKKNALKSSLTVAGAKALYECTPSNEPLVDDEKVLMLSFMLANNPHVCNLVGVPEYHFTDNMRDYVAGHPEIHNKILHAWIHQRIHDTDPGKRIAEPVLEDLGRLHCQEAYDKAICNVRSKHDKEIGKLTKRLSDLGYGADGKPINADDKAIVKDGKPEGLRAKIEEMKVMHPDAVMVARVGDFYECFGEDAVKMSDILGLTKIVRDGETICGFPHHALDSYLPRLIRAGVRICIIEEDAYKSKK